MAEQVVTDVTTEITTDATTVLANSPVLLAAPAVSGVAVGIDTTVLQLARDTVAGYTGAYYFSEVTAFTQYEQSYMLCLCDRIEFTGNYDQISCISDDEMHFVYFHVDSAGSVHYTWIPYYGEHTSTFSRAGVFYSSLDYTPHLQEGAAYYGYLQAVITVCLCVFVLLDRILRHVR